MFAKPQLLATLMALALTAAALAQQAKPPGTDRLEMKDGTSIRGLILRNDANNVLIRTGRGDLTIPKSDISRIQEEADDDVYVAELTAPGKLPSWRAIVHDFRDHDAVWRVQLAPSASVTEGTLRNIPYLSFNVNQRGILNIYGNPDDPVAIQFGIYGKRGRSDKYHQMVREFLAGHLNTRKEISTLYSLSLRGDKKSADNLVFEITPPTAPGAHGGWWVSVYDPRRVEKARVGAKEYAALTRPFAEVFTPDGTLREDASARFDQWLADSIMRLPAALPKIRGFYRDETGVFHVMRIGGTDGS
jgi:hypothetical protein